MVRNPEISQIWKWLEEVFDPEIPVLSVVDLGVVRNISIENELIKIEITPTYSGCPAMDKITADIYSKLAEKGWKNCEINSILFPSWTTDWISEKGRTKLLEFGIAPPTHEVDKNILFGAESKIACPKCTSKDTKMISLFGSTACKAHYQCNNCKEPFDYFKCLK